MNVDMPLAKGLDRGPRWPDQLTERPKHNAQIQNEGPIFQIHEIRLQSCGYVFLGASFASESPLLRKPRNPRLNERTKVIILERLRKLEVVLDQMRPRSHHAHLPSEHI